MVTLADADIVQYLTDTLPGSSGSPVFNQVWQLVAIRPAGGWLTEPGQKEKLFRNKGINVARLLALLAHPRLPPSMLPPFHRSIIGRLIWPQFHSILKVFQIDGALFNRRSTPAQ